MTFLITERDVILWGRLISYIPINTCLHGDICIWSESKCAYQYLLQNWIIRDCKGAARDAIEWHITVVFGIARMEDTNSMVEFFNSDV